MTTPSILLQAYLEEVSKFILMKVSNEKLMRMIEEKMDIPEPSFFDFREGVMALIGACAVNELDWKKFNPSAFDQLVKATEEIVKESDPIYRSQQ